MRALTLVGISAILGVVATSAHAANLLKNGSFEIRPPSAGCVSATTALYAWSVSAGNIDIESNTPDCSDVPGANGKYWLDLTGNGVGGGGIINQTVATTIGAHYKLTFYFGGNSGWQTGCPFSGFSNDGPGKSMNVSISGSVPIIANYSMDTTGQPCDSANWTYEGITFTATSPATTISFQSLDVTGVYGPLLDGVLLISVP